MFIVRANVLPKFPWILRDLIFVFSFCFAFLLLLRSQSFFLLGLFFPPLSWVTQIGNITLLFPPKCFLRKEVVWCRLRGMEGDYFTTQNEPPASLWFSGSTLWNHCDSFKAQPFLPVGPAFWSFFISCPRLFPGWQVFSTLLFFPHLLVSPLSSLVPGILSSLSWASLTPSNVLISSGTTLSYVLFASFLHSLTRFSPGRNFVKSF